MIWTISCLQFDISYGKPSENIKKAEFFIEKESKHADVLVLPELWTTGYDLANLDELADEDGRSAQSWLKKTAKNMVFILSPDRSLSGRILMFIIQCTSRIRKGKSLKSTEKPIFFS